MLLVCNNNEVYAGRPYLELPSITVERYRAVLQVALWGFMQLPWPARVIDVDCVQSTGAKRRILGLTIYWLSSPGRKHMDVPAPYRCAIILSV